MTIEFKEKSYGYKLYGEYGDVLGKIDIEWQPSFHPKKDIILMVYELVEISKFMESLECQKESL